MIGSLVPRRPASGSYWPFFTVKEVLNVAESNFRFVPESGHSLTVNGATSIQSIAANPALSNQTAKFSRSEGTASISLALQAQ